MSENSGYDNLPIAMSNPTCSRCGVEIADGVRYCRQCGQDLVAAGSENPSEEATRTFETPPEDGSTTQRLDARPTNPNYHTSREFPPLAQPAARSLQPLPRKSLTRYLILAIVIAAVAVAVIVAVNRRKPSGISRPLFYPGAQTIVDTKHEGGSTLHLRTRDSFEKVSEWYAANLKPEKTIRMSDAGVILKTGGTTITVVTEGDETNIVIKQAK